MILNRMRKLLSTVPTLIHGVGAGDYDTMFVANSGVGMIREVIDGTFEPFFTAKRLAGIAGLGPSMAYGRCGFCRSRSMQTSWSPNCPSPWTRGPT